MTNVHFNQRRTSGKDSEPARLSCPLPLHPRCPLLLLACVPSSPYVPTACPACRHRRRQALRRAELRRRDLEYRKLVEYDCDWWAADNDDGPWVPPPELG